METSSCTKLNQTGVYSYTNGHTNNIPDPKSEVLHVPARGTAYTLACMLSIKPDNSSPVTLTFDMSHSSTRSETCQSSVDCACARPGGVEKR